MGKGTWELNSKVSEPIGLESTNASKTLAANAYDKVKASAESKPLDAEMLTNWFKRDCHIIQEGVAKYSLSGIGKAWEHDYETGAWKDKVITGVAIGILMRAALPKAGALKAVVGTIMTGIAAVDVAKPFVEACDMGNKAKTVSDLDKASRHAGNGIGAFAVDTALTLPAGIYGEKGTGALLERTKWGQSFEAFKAAKIYSRESGLGLALSTAIAPFVEAPGKALSKFEKSMDAKTKELKGPTLSELVNSKELKLSKEQKQEFLDEMDEMVLKFNLDEQRRNGNHIELTEQQLEKLNTTRTEKLEQYQQWLEANELHTSQPVKKNFIESLTQAEEAVKKTAEPGKPADGKQMTESTPLSDEKKAYFDPQQFNELAKATRKLETELKPQRQEIEAIKDQLKMMIVAASDPHTKTCLPPEYIPNTMKLIALINSVETPQELNMVYGYLSMLNTSCQQLLTNHPVARMMLSYSIMSDMRLKKGILDAGLSPELLKGIVPATSAVEYSQGGPAIWPASEDIGWNVASVPFEYLLRVPTLVAKLGAYGHEFKGHGRSGKKPDGTGKIWRFDEDVRHDLIKNIVKEALDGHDEPVMLSNGKPLKDSRGKDVKLSEWLETELLECSEELTADMMGFVDNGLTLPHSLNNLVAGSNKNKKVDITGMMSPAFSSAETPWGREGHPYTTFRDECAKEMHKLLARHPERHAEADELGRLVEATRDPGDNYLCEIFRIGRNSEGRQEHQYTGVDIVVPKKWMDKCAKPLVKAQFETPIQRHEGKRIRDMIVDYQTTYDKMMSLAPEVAEAILKGKSGLPDFDKTKYDMVDVANGVYLGMLHQKVGSMPMERRIELAGNILRSLSSNFDDLLQVQPNKTPEPLPNLLSQEGRKKVASDTAINAYNLAKNTAGFLRTFPENAGVRLAPTVGVQMPQTIQGGELLLQHMLKKDMEDKAKLGS